MKKKAFTIMEALASILIFGFFMSIVSRIQVTSLLRYSKWRQEIERIFLIEKAAIKSYLNPSKDEEHEIVKKYEVPDLEVRTGIKRISGKSSLKKWDKNIKISETVGKWGDLKELKNLSLFTLVFLVEEDDK
ncbi:hypothetical protein KAW80_01725 [Candidatus Babeliales bacterium]|nr:hypothetical protein [Candidatus Babeliales bacterium]